jgi:hypothetical protein
MTFFGAVIYIAIMVFIVGGLFAAALLPVIDDERERRGERNE